MTSLRATTLFCVLALTTSHSAFGATVTVDGFVFSYSVNLHGGLYTTVWDDSKHEIASGSLGLHSSNGPMYSEITARAGSDGGSFYIRAKAMAAASDEHRGAMAFGVVSLLVEDRVNPTYSGTIDVGESVTLVYTQHFFIDGSIVGSATLPGDLSAGASVLVMHDNDILVLLGESLDSGFGIEGSMPRGNLSWTVEVTPTVQYDQKIRLEAGVFAGTVEDKGAASGEVNFMNTFRWGEVTDVFMKKSSTGELIPIPAGDFHLYGEDGFDWAHPPAASAAVPEPASFMMMTVGLLGFAGWRRRQALKNSAGMVA